MTTKPINVDEYINGFPVDVQTLLQQVRVTIKKALPQAEETIKYNIPTYVFKGNVVSFAGYKKHIGLYPVPAGDEAFEKETKPYKAAKSTLQLPLDKPLPLDLITKIVELRAKAMVEKAGK